MKNRRKWLLIFFVLIFFGVMNFLAAQSIPGWANIRGVVIVRLIGVGMCFGAAIFSFAVYIHGRRFTED
jgi:hypothetical protein